MNKATEKKVRKLRAMLGGLIREADDTVRPLRRSLEGGYRWEETETEKALDVSQYMQDGIYVAFHEILDLLTMGSLTVSEAKRMEEAKGLLERATDHLMAIDAGEMRGLLDKWSTKPGMDISEGHEAYFIKHFVVAMKLMRAAWNKLFYTTQATGNIRYLELTMSETTRFHTGRPEFASQIREQADDLARKSGTYVEVYDAFGDIAHFSTPDVVPIQRAFKGPKALAEYIKNPSGLRRDHAMARKLWALKY